MSNDSAVEALHDAFAKWHKTWRPWLSVTRYFNDRKTYTDRLVHKHYVAFMAGWEAANGCKVGDAVLRVTAAQVVESANHADLILLHTDAPDPAYPFTAPAVVKLSAAKGTGAQWVEHNLGIVAERIER